MKRTLCWSLSLVMFFAPALSRADKLVVRAENSTDWGHFEEAMLDLRENDRENGYAYIVSGSLVTLGGLMGSHYAEDTGAKFMFGFTQSLGIAAVGYGIAKLAYGNDYNSFFEAVQHANLTREQRDELVRRYLAEEARKRASLDRIAMFTHTLIGATNLYSASQESDKNAKNIFYFFAAANFALALSYAF